MRKEIINDYETFVNVFPGAATNDPTKANEDLINQKVEEATKAMSEELDQLKGTKGTLERQAKGLSEKMISIQSTLNKKEEELKETNEILAKACPEDAFNLKDRSSKIIAKISALETQVRNVATDHKTKEG